jgi:hypothetical protein
MHLKCLVMACLLLVPIGCFASDNAALGSLEGHLRILASRDAELADGTPSKLSGGNYADYPLIIVSHDGKKEIARVRADESGNYHVALPPGDYVLDVENRKRRHVRVTPVPFTIVSNQTVQVDMNIDTGVR